MEEQHRTVVGRGFNGRSEFAFRSPDFLWDSPSSDSSACKLKNAHFEPFHLIAAVGRGNKGSSKNGDYTEGGELGNLIGKWKKKTLGKPGK